MIDHIGIRSSDLARSKAFYAKALAPVGYAQLMEFPGGVGYGVAPKPDFWIDGRQSDKPIDHVHVAFRVTRRTEVKAFYDAAIAAGGKDNGAPGVRPHYHPDYYAAFVLDPDGHNIEVVCHEPYLG